MGGKGSGRLPSFKTPPEEATKRQQAKVVHLLKGHPRLDVVPDPDLPMTNAALLKYREYAEMLLKAGQLTTITKAQAEAVAVTFGQIHARQTEGLDVSANLIQRYQSGLAQLQLLDVDRQAPGTSQQQKNRFRHSGFASRLR